MGWGSLFSAGFDGIINAASCTDFGTAYGNTVVYLFTYNADEYNNISDVGLDVDDATN